MIHMDVFSNYLKKSEGERQFWEATLEKEIRRCKQESITSKDKVLASGNLTNFAKRRGIYTGADGITLKELREMLAAVKTA